MAPIDRGAIRPGADIHWCRALESIGEVEVLASERLVVPLQACSTASVDEFGDHIFQEYDTHPFPAALREKRLTRVRCLLRDLPVGAREKEHNLRLLADVHKITKDLIMLQEERGVVAVFRQVRRILEQRRIRIAKLVQMCLIHLRATKPVLCVFDLDEEIPTLLISQVEIE